MKRRIEMAHGFPDCLGFLDGTGIILDLKPARNHQDYYNRKSRYSINAQILCDLDHRIRFAFVGYPGSVHDSACIGYSPLINHVNQYFDPPEYVLTDSAYSLTETFIPSFKRPLAEREPYKSFNAVHSGARVHVERCIGELKGRFQSLRGMRIQISDDSDHERVIRWFTACYILHNMLLGVDEWEEEDDGEENEDEEGIEENNMGNRLNQRETAVQKRENLVRTVLCLR